MIPRARVDRKVQAVPNDKAYNEAKKRGIKKVVTIHPSKARPDLYMHVYIVRKAGERGGHTVHGNITSSKGFE
jgi:hypothetical protein